MQLDMLPYDWDQDPWNWLESCAENSNLKLDYSELDGFQEGVRQRPSLRIIKIEPGMADKPLRCSLVLLRDHEVADTPYEAVSYVWGASKDRVPIRCKNGEPGDSYSYGWILVTQNCAQVFQTLRRVDEPRYVWIDAISIDQDDNDDKIHFVRQMHQTYRRASQVIVVLPNYKLDDGDWWAQPALGPWIFEHIYFTRIWILQEVFHGRNPIVHAGDHTISWSELCHLYSIYSKESIFLNDTLRISVETVLTMGQSNLESRPGFREEHTLQDLFSRSRAFDATDERDKIIALISMARNIGPAHEALLVDYNASYEVILHRFIILCCFRTLHISRLVDVGFTHEASDFFGMGDGLSRGKWNIDATLSYLKVRPAVFNHMFGLPSTTSDIEIGRTQAQAKSSLTSASFFPRSSLFLSRKVPYTVFLIKVAFLGLWISSMPVRDCLLFVLIISALIFVFLADGLHSVYSFIWKCFT